MPHVFGTLRKLLRATLFAVCLTYAKRIGSSVIRLGCDWWAFSIVASARERIDEPHAGRREMLDVARYDNQIVEKSRGGDLLVERILGMRNA
jgi:hypothetical protein